MYSLFNCFGWERIDGVGHEHNAMNESTLIPSYRRKDHKSHCFYAGGSSRGRRQRRGEDVVHPLKVSLEDLYLGTSKKLSLSRNVICSKCNGLALFLCLFLVAFFLCRFMPSMLMFVDGCVSVKDQNQALQ